MKKTYYTSQIIHSSLDTRYKDLRKTLNTHEGQTLLWARQMIYKDDGRNDDDDDDEDNEEKGGNDEDDDLVVTKSVDDIDSKRGKYCPKRIHTFH